MLFLYLCCKKENFLPFTTWIFLSSLGVFLTNNLGTRAYLIKQSHTSNIIKTNRFDLQNKYDQLNIAATESQKFVTFPKFIAFYAESFFMRIFQKILTMNLFLIKIPAIDTRLRNFQMQYFSNKRAPPNGHT
ncbi:hypothetical protein [Bartonella tribocorum]|uniref:Uncharacterized protein n=1 Tax=Bartonella tribocorum TaxID=85701 RepID=A0A2M6US27_9HYPH|nr:hypothetical protein [Bartonella tribocorum]PIT68973.1 hypothetical protein CEV08_07065 [Bartonella tribocorum]